MGTVASDENETYAIVPCAEVITVSGIVLYGQVALAGRVQLYD